MRRLALAAIALLGSSAAVSQDGQFRVYEQLPGVGLSLMLVVGLIVLVAWVLRRSPLGAFSRANGPLKIVATLPLGPKERLVLVETGGTRLLLGVAPAGIFRLNEPAEVVPGNAPAGARISDLLQEAG